MALTLCHFLQVTNGSCPSVSHEGSFAWKAASNMSTGLPETYMVKFLKLGPPDTARLTECNFNNCYWIPGKLLKNFLIQCPNLESLFVAESLATINHLMSHILPACRKITALSLTMYRGDWTHAKRHVSCVTDSRDPIETKFKPSTKPGDPGNPHIIQRMLAFYQSCKVLNDLKDLTIVLTGSVENFASFTRNCPNLEHLTVVRDREKRGKPKRDDDVAKVAKPSFLNAKSCVFVGTVTGEDCYPDILFGSELNTFWSNTLTLPRNFRQQEKISAMSWGKPEDRFVSVFRVDFNSRGFQQWNVNGMESYSEPFPIIMLNPFTAPHLKLASCFFVFQGFPRFCQSHPHLEALRLRSGEGDLTTDESWIPGSWGRLPNLRILSLEPSLIIGRSLKPLAGVIIRPFLSSILQNFPLLEELEIAYFSDSTAFDRVEMSPKEMTAIAQCLSLKKLTLAHLDLEDGRFLTQILTNCKRLESLRLKDLGTTGHCYTWDLCAGLPHAKHLTTLCIFQNATIPFEELLSALETCPSLIRLSLVTPFNSFPVNWTGDEIFTRLFIFCDRLKHLVALFLGLYLSKSFCLYITKYLNQVVMSKRPAFRADVQPAGHLVYDALLECYSEIIPLIHKEILVNFNSQVGVFPHGSRSFLQ